MNPLLGPQPRQRRYRVRHQAHLDAETHTMLEDLACTFQRKRSATLRLVMQWGLHHSTGWTIDRSPVVGVPPVPVLLEPELLHQVQETAAAYRVSMAAWLREAVRRIMTGDFPASWREGKTISWSHDSGYYDRKYQLRLDEATSQTLETLTYTFGRPAAEVIRQLIMPATREDFPPSWQMAAAERRRHPS